MLVVSLNYEKPQYLWILLSYSQDPDYSYHCWNLHAIKVFRCNNLLEFFSLVPRSIKRLLPLLFSALGELVCLCLEIQVGGRKVTYSKFTSLLTSSLWGNKSQILGQSLPRSLYFVLLMSACGCGNMHRLEIKTPQMMDLSGGMSNFENKPLQLSMSSYWVWNSHCCHYP